MSEDKKQQAILEAIVRQRNDAINRCAVLEAELALARAVEPQEEPQKIGKKK